MRGSTALLGACDTVIKTAKLESVVTLSVEKQKDAEPIPDMCFEMVPIALIDDVSVVMKPVDAPSKSRRVKLTSDQSIALQALRNTAVELGRDRVTVSAWHDAHRVKTPDLTSVKRRDARAALQQKRVIFIEDNKVWLNKDLGDNV